jgi:hypothetical protein
MHSHQIFTAYICGNLIRWLGINLHFIVKQHMENTPSEHQMVNSSVNDDTCLLSPKHLYGTNHKHLSCERSTSNAKSEYPIVDNLFPTPTTTQPTNITEQ